MPVVTVMTWDCTLAWATAARRTKQTVFTRLYYFIRTPLPAIQWLSLVHESDGMLGLLLQLGYVPIATVILKGQEPPANQGSLDANTVNLFQQMMQAQDEQIRAQASQVQQLTELVKNLALAGAQSAPRLRLEVAQQPPSKPLLLPRATRQVLLRWTLTLGFVLEELRTISPRCLS